MPLTKPNPCLPTQPAQSGLLQPPNKLAPKPILKPSPSPSPVPSPVREPSPPYHSTSASKHAHFPPPGEEPTARFSGVDYDRTPIVVLPNVCALPARGCPGKTFYEEKDAKHPGVRGSTILPPSTAGSDHAHPSKLVKKAHLPSAPLLAPSASNIPPLVHSPQYDNCTSSEESEEDFEVTTAPVTAAAAARQYPPVAVVFPPQQQQQFQQSQVQVQLVAGTASVPSFAAYQEARARKGSNSSARTVIPSNSQQHARKRSGAAVSTDGNTSGSVWSASESSEDDCLSGF